MKFFLIPKDKIRIILPSEEEIILTGKFAADTRVEKVRGINIIHISGGIWYTEGVITRNGFFLFKGDAKATFIDHFFVKKISAFGISYGKPSNLRISINHDWHIYPTYKNEFKNLKKNKKGFTEELRIIVKNRTNYWKEKYSSKKDRIHNARYFYPDVIPSKPDETNDPYAALDWSKVKK